VDGLAAVVTLDARVLDLDLWVQRPQPVDERLCPGVE
jgi:hypothetical protein